MMLENKVYLKRFLLFSMIPIVVFLIVGNVFFFYQYHSYMQNYNNKIASMVRLLEKEYPDIDKNELISVLNHDDKMTEDSLSQYGIDIQKESIISKNDTLFVWFVIIYNGGLLIGVFSIVLLYLRHEKAQSTEIKKIVKCMEKINRKNYSIDIDSNSEDELSILKNEIYKITVMLKEEAENSKKEKLKLKDSLSDISHQLKTPLTSIHIMLDNILDNPKMERDVKEKFIQNIRREVSNISSLVEEILKLSKFDADVIVFEKQQVFINEIVKRAISNVEMMAELKNIQFEVSGCSDIKLMCDKRWQIEAITNILKNCVEYSNACSHIVIDMTFNKIYKQITIQDSGSGIDEKDLPHIFERFYKGGNSSKDSVGIGLALAKTIIEKDGGYIRVDSKKGKKTVFTIRYY